MQNQTLNTLPLLSGCMATLSLLQIKVGVGCPVALQDKLKLSPIVRLMKEGDEVFNIRGGTVTILSFIKFIKKKKLAKN